MDSTSSDKREEIENICELHGSYLSSRHWLFSSWSNWSPCPVCQKQNEAQVEKEMALKRAEMDATKRLNLLKLATMPIRYKDAKIDTYARLNEQSQKCANYCKTYAATFPEKLESGTCIMMLGNTGTGKTHLACAIIHYIIEHFMCSAKFTSAIKAVRDIKATYGSSKLTEGEVIQSFTYQDLLVLDEVGIGTGSDTEKMLLWEIVNERYLAKKPTIITSNMDRNELASYTSVPFVDRLKENGGTVLNFNWDSYRNATTQTA